MLKNLEMSNIPSNFAENIYMNILKTLENCIGKLPHELINGKVLYVELDKTNYDELDNEINETYVMNTQKVDDIGNKCKVLKYLDYKIVVTVNEQVVHSNNFYIAFKIDII